jgi:D-3-phosphoglycerate dehydrogenase
MARILIIDDVYESLVSGLIAAGHEVFYEPSISVAQVADRCIDLRPDGLIVRSKLHLGESFFSRVSSVKWIGRAGAGVDNIDEKAASERGIKLFHAAGANADSVAEHVIGMLLAFRHKLLLSHSSVVSGVWDREVHRGFELKGKVVGIVGYGFTGSALARKLRGFDVEILAYDRFKQGFGNEYVREVNISELLGHADVISLHVPLTDLTRNWVNEEFIEGCKEGLVLINSSRGEVIDIQSIYSSLERGKIGGLLLDVYPQEPPMKLDNELSQYFQQLSKNGNVMFSPHVAGWSVESYQNISEVLLSKLLTDI